MGKKMNERWKPENTPLRLMRSVAGRKRHANLSGKNVYEGARLIAERNVEHYKDDKKLLAYWRKVLDAFDSQKKNLIRRKTYKD